MAEERQILLEIEVDKKGAQKQLEENAELLELNKAELANLNKAYKEGEIDVADYAKAKLQLTQENKRLGNQNRNLIRTLETESNSLNALRQNLSRLTAERNNINQQTVEGAKRFAELQKQILNTTDAIKEQEEAGGDFRRSVGNYQTALKGSIFDTQVFGTSINGLVDKFKSFINPVTASIGLIGALGAAYLKTGRGAKDLARASDRLDSALNDLNNSVADFVGATGERGLLDGVLQVLQTRFLGLASTIRSNLIVAIKEQVREFELLELQTNRTAKALLDQAEQQRQIRDDERNSFSERTEANQKLLDLINERESIRIATQEKQVANLKVLLNLDKDNVELQKALAQAEFELADIREEAQGFRSEQAANDLALFRELNEDQLALTTARINEELILVEQGTREELELKEKLIDEQLKLQLKAVGDNEIRQNIVIQEALNARLQLYKDYRSNLVDIQKIQTDQEVDNLEILKERVVKIDTSKTQKLLDNIKAQMEAEKLKNETTLQASSFLAGTLSDQFEQTTAAYKIFASIEAAISTYLAINKTLGSLPFPANTIAATAIGIQGFANVAKINGLFGGGGGASSGNGVQTNTPTITRTTRTTLDGSFDRNQLTSGANNAQADRDNITNSINNLPTPVVKVTDINKVQNQTTKVKVSGSL